MAKTCMVQKEIRRAKMVKRYAAKRALLKAKVSNIHLPEEERWNAQLQLQALPRNASPSRQRNRCHITGKSRGVYRKFGLCRNMIRILAMRGDIPGIVKSSW